MASFQKPRGTTDWYGIEYKKFTKVCDILQNLAINFNFTKINPPTFEHIELFKKSIGEVTDITQKELYTIVDRKNRILALRPEGTSSVVRAYVENKLFANKNNSTKLFYILNLFRYERPQSGRLREFHQFGIEYLNVTNHLEDIECLIFANNIIKEFGLQKYITLKINFLGSFEQRQAWIEELKKYFMNFENELTQDSINRIHTNPLRILDDKVDSKKDFVKNAPKLANHLTQEDNKVFNDILKGLTDNNIEYQIDDSLVRGLDYYTGVVFEFVYKKDDFETTVIGGGRYSDLVRQTGGPDQIGLGFALGIERLLICLDQNNYDYKLNDNLNVLIGAHDYGTSILALIIANNLRLKNIKTDLCLGNYNRSKNAKQAIKNNVDYFIFIDENYNNDKKIMIENIKNGNRAMMTLNELLEMDLLKN